MSDTHSVEIPKSLYSKIEKHIQNTKHENVADYMIYAARLCLLKEESHEACIPDEEKEKIKNKLRNLGYIE